MTKRRSHSSVAVTVFGGWATDVVWSTLRSDLRLAKAGFLCGDRLRLASGAASSVLRVLRDTSDLIAKSRGSSESETHALFNEAANFVGERVSPQDRNTLVDFAKGMNLGAIEVVGDYEAGIAAGMLGAGHHFDDMIPLYTAEWQREVSADPVRILSDTKLDSILSCLERLIQTTRDASTLDTYSRLADFVRSERHKPTGERVTVDLPAASAESLVVPNLLGGTECFPDADWDVLVDVCDKTSGARIRLRAALQEAADELRNLPLAEVDAACDAIRRRIVQPALAEMDEQLGELSVRPTLLRLTSDTPAVGSLIANLVLAAATPEALGITAVLHAAASAPLLASIAKEARNRRDIRRSVTMQPYWLLREAQG